MAWRVDEIQDIRLTILRLVIQTHRVGFDRDAALALEVHVVQNLRRHVPTSHRAGQFQQTVGERRFAVIDVRDD